MWSKQACAPDNSLLETLHLRLLPKRPKFNWLFSGPEEWNAMVEEIVVACAGLVQYLADAYPPDLPEYDPV